MDCKRIAGTLGQVLCKSASLLCATARENIMNGNKRVSHFPFFACLGSSSQKFSSNIFHLQPTADPPGCSSSSASREKNKLLYIKFSHFDTRTRIAVAAYEICPQVQFPAVLFSLSCQLPLSLSLLFVINAIFRTVLIM